MPEFHFIVPAARDQPLAVGTKCDAVHPVVVAMQYRDLGGQVRLLDGHANIPKPDRRVRAGGGKTGAVRAKGDTVYCLPLAGQCRKPRPGLSM